MGSEREAKGHTPGPWRTSKFGYIAGYDGEGPYGARHVQIGIVGAYFDKELLRFNKARWDADARLISAAPDLLWAAHVALAALGASDAGKVVRAAITKATGGTPAPLPEPPGKEG